MPFVSILGSVALAATLTAAPTAAAHDPQQRCARQFDRALGAYIDTTQRRDARGFERLLAPDYTVILPGGTTLVGKAAGSQFIDEFFARTDWTQTFDETSRAVEGCRTALAVYDSVYSDADGPEPLVIALTWTYRHGHWLVLTDQNTPKD